MNLITIQNNGKYFYVRPETSLCRDEGNDYFCLDNILELTVYTFLYTKIEKAAKCVQAKFAERYYNNLGYGIHLIASKSDETDSNCNTLNINENLKWYVNNSLDNTTFIHELSPEEISCNNAYTDTKKLLNSALEKVSSKISLRTGDLLILENTIQPLAILEKELKSNIKSIDTLKYKDIELKIHW